MSYSFNLEEYIEEDEISSQDNLCQASLSESTKNRLKEILPLLEKNIVDLVQDADPIMRTFLAIKDHLQPNLMEALVSVANIEDQASKVKKARRNLMEHEALLAKKDPNKQEAKELMKLIDNLKKSPSEIASEHDQLKAKRAELE